LKENFKEKEMRNKIFGLTTAIALSMIVAGGLWAQETGIGGMGVSGWSSPQSTATQGRIRSAADDFIRPDSYTSARIEKWFGMASFQSTLDAHLGFAKKLEKAYIGVYYGGSFWANVTPFNYTESYVADWPGGPRVVPNYTTLNFAGSAPSNRVAVLIGVADMGFRFSFFSSYESFNESDIASGTDYYRLYKQGLGSLRPQLAWSMTKNLAGDKGIKPYVTVDLNFRRDYRKSEEAAVNSPGEEIDHSNNYVQPVFQMGLGGFNLYSKESFRLSTDLEYRLTLVAYNNEYSYLNSVGKYQTEKIKGRNRTGLTLTEDSYFSNWIAPYLAAQWGSGPVALRARLQLPMTITSTKETHMDLDSNNKLIKEGTDTSTTAFVFNPSLQLALQWRPISKLALNVGGLINLGNIGRTTTEGSTYVNDVETPLTSTKGVTKRYDGTANQLTLGATFNPTDNLAFEAVCGATASNTAIEPNGNRLNVFDTSGNGLFNFGSILVSLKF
jgi:hypothetical protein